MELSKLQKKWLDEYEEARKNGGAMSDTGWIEFDEIPVPGWYETYTNYADAPSANNHSESVSVLPGLDYAPAAFDREYFRMMGRKGGKIGGAKTALRGKSYFSELGSRPKKKRGS